MFTCVQEVWQYFYLLQWGHICLCLPKPPWKIHKIWQMKHLQLFIISLRCPGWVQWVQSLFTKCSEQLDGINKKIFDDLMQILAYGSFSLLQRTSFFLILTHHNQRCSIGPQPGPGRPCLLTALPLLAPCRARGDLPWTQAGSTRNDLLKYPKGISHIAALVSIEVSL